MAAEQTPQRFYFTFGLGHENAKRFVVIDAVDWDEAREVMFGRFGRRWAFQYDESDWFRDGVSQEERYSLTELP